MVIKSAFVLRLTIEQGNGTLKIGETLSPLGSRDFAESDMAKLL
jgi:hypothetical protein